MFKFFKRTPRVILTNTQAWTTGYTGVGVVGNTVLPKVIEMYRTPVAGGGSMYGQVYTSGKVSGSINFGYSYSSSSPAPKVANDSSGNFWFLHWYAYNQASNTEYGIPVFSRQSGAASLSDSSITNASNLVDFSDFLLNGNDAMWVSKHSLYGSNNKYTYWYYYNSSTNTWSTGTWSTNTALIPKAIGYQNSKFVIFYTDTASPTVLKQSQYNTSTNTWSAGSVLSTSSVFSGTWHTKSYENLNVNNKSYFLITNGATTWIVEASISLAETTLIELGAYVSGSYSAAIVTNALNNVPGFQLCWRNSNTFNYYFYDSSTGTTYTSIGDLNTRGLAIPHMPIKVSNLSNGALYVDEYDYRPYIKQATFDGALLAVKKPDALSWASAFNNRYNWVPCGKTIAWLSGVPNDQYANSTVYINRG